MTNRVVLGNKGGQYGLWVSRAGYDVLTTADSNMLFSMSGSFLQILQQGTFSIPIGTNPVVNIPLSGTNGVAPYVFIYIKEAYNNGTRAYLYNNSSDVTVTSTNLNIQFGVTTTNPITGSYICLYDGQ